MNKFFKYASYLIRHKFFVAVESARLGNLWLGLLHDNSKIRPSEFGPYMEFFYGDHATRESKGDSTGYYKPTDTGDVAFDFAWLLHQKRNKHHWQWWVLPEDEGGTKVLDMPMKYRKEMLADWKGAGRAQGKPDTLGWYRANRTKMQLHPDTRAWIEEQLGYHA